MAAVLLPLHYSFTIDARFALVFAGELVAAVLLPLHCSF